MIILNFCGVPLLTDDMYGDSHAVKNDAEEEPDATGAADQDIGRAF